MGDGRDKGESGVGVMTVSDTGELRLVWGWLATALPCK